MMLKHSKFPWSSNICIEKIASRGMSYRSFPFQKLELFSIDIFTKLGLSLDDATIVGKSLVKANLRGQDGHGISRIPIYSKRLQLGQVNPKPNIIFENVTPVVVSCDGDHGMGVIVTHQAMNRAIDIAKIYGLSMVGIKRSTHFGASAEYVQQALDANMLSMVFTNSSPALPPHGAAKAFLGASPIAAGAPSGQEHPFLMDMSSTVIARGKLRLASQRGEPIAAGIGLDKNGKPTRDGMEAFHGVTLPFGGVKGAAISTMMEIFAGLFTGASFGGRVSSLYNDFSNKQDVGHLLIVMRSDLFMSADEFSNRMDELNRRIKELPLAEGFQEILMVGEPETRSEQHRREMGIPVQVDVIDQLNKIANDLEVDLL